MFHLVAAAIATLAGLGGAACAGFKYGQSIESVWSNLYKEAYIKYAEAHTTINAKLAAVKAELTKIEEEGKAEEVAVVKRIKAVLPDFLVGGGSGGGGK